MAEERACEARNLVEIDFRGLLDERTAFRFAHVVPKVEDLTLAGPRELLEQRMR